MTIFTTPVLKNLCHYFALAILKVFGWKMKGEYPDFDKCVMVAAPHTSNWDLPVMLFTAFAFKLPIYWLGKDSIFRYPLLGTFFKWLGGTPVDRSTSNNKVAQAVEIFGKNDKMTLTLAPEGTRSHVSRWKTGFYHIACGANVPIVLGFIDFGRKSAGILGVYHPTGDLESDMAKIQEYYKDISGKHKDGM